MDNNTLKKIIFIFLFAVFVLFFNLGGRTLENQDNIRFAEVGRELLETGDWVMMHLAGEIYVDKPPLHFWSMALSYRIFGVNAFAARFPSAFFAVLGVLGIIFFSFAADRGNPKTALYSALFLCSNYAYINYARTARIDTEFSVLFSLSLISFYAGFISEKSRYRIVLYAFFWFFTGMAFLDKGPVAFLALIIILVFLISQRNWKNTGVKVLLLTFLFLFLTILPWLLLLLTHKEFDQYLYLLKTSKIMTRQEGFFYYFYAFPMNFFPVSVFAAVAIPILWKVREEIARHSGVFFCLVWGIVYLLILHLTVAKNVRYILPVFIPFSFIAAWGIQKISFTKISGDRIKKYGAAAAWVTGIFICVAPSVWIYLNRGFIMSAVVLPVIGLSALFLVYTKFKDMIAFVCILCVTGFLSADIVRTTFNQKVSYTLKLYDLLKEQRIDADEILLYRTDPEIRKKLSFYYNRLLTQRDDTPEIRNNTEVVITSGSALGNVLKVTGSGKQYTRIQNRGEEDLDVYAVFLKHR